MPLFRSPTTLPHLLFLCMRTTTQPSDKAEALVIIRPDLQSPVYRPNHCLPPNCTFRALARISCIVLA